MCRAGMGTGQLGLRGKFVAPQNAGPRVVSARAWRAASPCAHILPTPPDLQIDALVQAHAVSFSLVTRLYTLILFAFE